MSRCADREGVPRARYCLESGNPRATLARAISHQFGVATFRRSGMHGAARAFLRDARAYRIREGIGNG